MTAINFSSETDRNIHEVVAQPVDENAAGDSCRSNRSSSSPEPKSETVYTFDALRKRDTTATGSQELEAPSNTGRILVGRNELQIGFICVLLAGQVVSWI